MKTLLIGLIKIYQYLLSPWVGNSCRFYPTCSCYALLAIEKHGALKGTYYTVNRLIRCNPWCQGGIDPVPGTEIKPLTEQSTTDGK